MGFNFNGIGALIEKLPGGKEAVHGLNVGLNPLVQVATPFVNLGGDIFKSVLNLSSTMTNAMANMAKGLGNMFSNPSTLMILGVAGLAIAGIYVLKK